jgi:hypothetical protein
MSAFLFIVLPILLGAVAGVILYQRQQLLDNQPQPARIEPRFDV